MKMEYHITLSVAVSCIIYNFFKSWEMAVANLITGIFIDVDHIVDYMAECGIGFEIRNFFRVCNEELSRKVYVFLHSWELMAVIAFFAWMSGWNPWATGVFIGYSHHMITDQYVNAPRLWSYFLAWRIFHKFEREGSFRVNKLYSKDSV